MALGNASLSLFALSQLLLLSSLVVRPSPYRWVFFLVILFLNAYLYFFVPTDASLKGSFVTYTFVASDFILLTDVQRDFSLVTQHVSISRASFYERLKWGLKLLISARGVGWNHEPASPIIPHHPSKSTSRLSFILSQLKWIAIYFLFYDLSMHFLIMRNPALSGKGVNFGDLTLLNRCAGLLGFVVGAYTTLSMLYAWMSIVMVGLNVSEPSEWPHFFGNWGDAYTIRKFWGRVWHQTLRRVVSSHGKYIAQKVLKFRPGSNWSSYTQLYIAFLISGVIHTNSYPFKFTLSFDRRPLFFFCSQAIAITFEDAVIAVLGRYYTRKQPGRLVKLVGYIWTYSWFVYCIPAWLDSMVSENVGTQQSSSFSIVALFL